jgi:hypothetical protein
MPGSAGGLSTWTTPRATPWNGSATMSRSAD